MFFCPNHHCVGTNLDLFHVHLHLFFPLWQHHSRHLFCCFISRNHSSDQGETQDQSMQRPFGGNVIQRLTRYIIKLFTKSLGNSLSLLGNSKEFIRRTTLKVPSCLQRWMVLTIKMLFINNWKKQFLPEIACCFIMVK